MQTPFTPSTTIIAFDLHGVLFNQDYPGMLKMLYRSQHKYLLAAYALNPAVWLLCFKLWRHASPIERYITSLTNEWPRLAPAQDDLITLANAQKPNKAIIQLVQELKQSGYELHIFSNIGTIILADLVTQFPQIMALFDHVFTTSAALGYPSKRHPALFNAYLCSRPTLANKKVIFIDDSINNVAHAQRYGILGIHAVNPEQIRARLRALGCLF